MSGTSLLSILHVGLFWTPCASFSFNLPSSRLACLRADLSTRLPTFLLVHFLGLQLNSPFFKAPNLSKSTVVSVCEQKLLQESMNSGNLPGFPGYCLLMFSFGGWVPNTSPVILIRSWPGSRWSYRHVMGSGRWCGFLRPQCLREVVMDIRGCNDIQVLNGLCHHDCCIWLAHGLEGKPCPERKHVQAGALIGEETCCGMSADGEAGCPRALEGTKRSKQRLGWWEMVGRFECDVEPQALSSANLPNTLTGHDRAMEHSPKPVPNSLRKPQRL